MLSVLKYGPEPIADMTIPDGFRVCGWVYVLSNECMPGIYKIGMTTNDPEMRAKEISQGTGVPAPFTVVKSYFSENPREDELVIHEELSEYRFNPNREFFKCPMSIIEDCIASNGLFERTTSVSKMANDYSIISFEERVEINLDDFFESYGFNVFGDRLAIAKRLIQMAMDTVKTLQRKGMALVFTEGMAVPVVQDMYRRYEERVMSEAKLEAETGVYGPSPLPEDSDLPF